MHYSTTVPLQNSNGKLQNTKLKIFQYVTLVIQISIFLEEYINLMLYNAIDF